MKVYVVYSTDLGGPFDYFDVVAVYKSEADAQERCEEDETYRYTERIVE